MVLVGHSYGGMVITELADHPAVIHAVYLAAFWPRPGQSINDFLGGELPDWIVPHDNGTVRVTEDFTVARNALCADIDPDLAADNLRRLQPQSVSSLSAPSSSRERRPTVTYVICERDNALPVQAQEQMAADADHIERLASSHQPMGSMPANVVEVLARAG